ncbi:MAG TPA: tetratricopeptide repeat protein [Magnetospirillaceae bacterium]|nr:tetratricopeptide repeat protein [Magnetospirillaceae bacterium]
MSVRILLAALGLTVAVLPALAESPRVTAEQQAVFARFQQLAEQGNSKATWEQGHFYLGDLVGPKDQAAYERYMRKAAEEGYPFAQFELGMALQKSDPADSLNWLLKSAQTGNEMAQLAAATAFYNGQGTDKNPILAYGWYKVIVQTQTSPGDGMVTMARAQTQTIAKRLSSDEITSADFTAADLKAHIANPAEAQIKAEEAVIFEQMRDLAQQGNSVAQYRLGGLYTSGQGVAADPAASFSWYSKSAENGYIYAEISVGDAYAAGRGVDKDEGQALAHYRKAADRGNPDAEIQVGDAYRNGKGVAQNNAEAYFWISLAVQNMADNPRKLQTYRTFPDAVAKTLSRDVIAEQDARRKAWTPVEAN